MNKLLFILVGIYFLCLLSAGEGMSQWKKGDENKCPASGPYINSWYGFQIEIPTGMTGCPNSPVFMSDHGVLIPLVPAKTRWIECYAGYNGPLYSTVEEAVDSTIDWLKENARPESLEIKSRLYLLLDGIKAERVLIQYTDKESGVVIIKDTIELLRSIIKENAAPSHQYSLSLFTTPDHYASDHVLFEQVIKSWRKAKSEDESPNQ